MDIPFQALDWSRVEKKEYPGEMGLAIWQTLEFPGLRIRLVEYSANYKADHWCEKGHIVHCLEGEFTTELKGGEPVSLQKGESFLVADNQSSHRSFSEKGARLFIVDGDFLG